MRCMTLEGLEGAAGCRSDLPPGEAFAASGLYGRFEPSFGVPQATRRHEDRLGGITLCFVVGFATGRVIDGEQAEVVCCLTHGHCAWVVDARRARRISRRDRSG